MYILYYKGAAISVHNTQVEIAKKFNITRQSVFGAINKGSYINKDYQVKPVDATNAHLISQLIK